MHIIVLYVALDFSCVRMKVGILDALKGDNCHQQPWERWRALVGNIANTKFGFRPLLLHEQDFPYVVYSANMSPTDGEL